LPQSESRILKKAVAAFKSCNILVVGDLIIDHFIWGSVSRISPEAPVPVVNVTHENLLLGGSANVLHNLYSLGAKASICGAIGNDAMGDQIIALINDLQSPIAGVIRVNDRPTTIKTRIIARQQQVVRFDREHTGPIEGEQLDRIKAFITNNISSFKAVIVSDYAKGIIAPELMDHLRKELQQYPQISLVIDPKPDNPARFKGATIVTPNHFEAEQISGIAIIDQESLERAGRQLLDDLDSKAVLITRGEAGMSLFERDRPTITIPTVAKEVFDVTGAGDTVIATLALGLAANLSFSLAATLANYAAGIVVGKLGTATVTTDELVKALP
jgi:D-beta-D-heptose 7-phosphate kinase/D-beta-D-heptose 1-phosphate adenosyltransferase